MENEANLTLDFTADIQRRLENIVTCGDTCNDVSVDAPAAISYNRDGSYEVCLSDGSCVQGPVSTRCDERTAVCNGMFDHITEGGRVMNYETERRVGYPMSTIVQPCDRDEWITNYHVSDNVNWQSDANRLHEIVRNLRQDNDVEIASLNAGKSNDDDGHVNFRMDHYLASLETKENDGE